jgi:glycosyltransferase involved in cell wall biosynthesis
VKILLTAHQFFPEFTAGTEVLTRSVMRELIERGHEVRVMTGYPGDSDVPDHERTDEYLLEGVRIHRFHHAYVPMGGQTSKIDIGFDNRLAANYFRRIIDSFCPDLIHFFHLNRLGTGLISQAVDAGIPAHFTPTDFWTICPTAQLLYSDGRVCSGPTEGSGNCVVHFMGNTVGGYPGKLASRLPAGAGAVLVRMASTGLFSSCGHAQEVRALSRRLDINVERLNQLDSIVAPNQMIAQLMLRYGINPDLVHVVSYGVEIAEWDIHIRRTVPKLPLRIGFIGTLAAHKGCHVLIEAFNLLPKKMAALKIFGSEGDFPDYSATLQELAQGNDAIEFCGTFPSGKIGDVLGDLDLIVVPSVWNENTPLVIASAQAWRCPIVASDVPGIASVVRDEVDGILFEAGNVEGLAGELERLVADPSILVGLSAACRAPKTVPQYVDQLMGIWGRNTLNAAGTR